MGSCKRHRLSIRSIDNRGFEANDNNNNDDDDDDDDNNNNNDNNNINDNACISSNDVNYKNCN